jgi:hypothetical protein
MKTKLTIIALLIATTLQAQIVEPVPFDKKWHMGAGAVAGVWGTFMGNSLDLSAEESVLVGVGVSLVAGIGKECMDIAPVVFGRKDVRFDPMDVAATTLGGIIGVGLTYAGLKIFKKSPVIYSFADTKSVQVGIILNLDKWQKK